MLPNLRSYIPIPRVQASEATLERIDFWQREGFPVALPDTREDIGHPSAGLRIATLQEDKSAPRVPNGFSRHGDFIMDCRDSRIKRQRRKQDVTPDPTRTASHTSQRTSSLYDGGGEEEPRHDEEISHQPTVCSIMEEEKTRRGRVCDALHHRTICSVRDLRGKGAILALELEGFVAGIAGEVHDLGPGWRLAKIVAIAGRTVELFTQPLLGHDAGYLGRIRVPRSQDWIESKVHKPRRSIM